MSNGFPCPNPACTHVFAAESIKGVASVNCPRCGTVFQFRNVASAPAKPSPFPPPSAPAPGVPPPPPPPPSKPVPPPIPSAVAPPSAPTGPGFDFNAPAAPRAPVVARSVASNLSFDEPTPSSSSRSKKKRRRGSSSKFVGLIIFLLLAGAVAGAAYYFRDSIPWGEGDEQRKGFKTKGNFAITVPSAWKLDDTLRSKFRVLTGFARSRAKPRAHFVLRYHDYKHRMPTDAELFDDALKRLRGYFTKVEYINPFEQDNKGRNSEIAGESALVFTFSAADATQVPLRGECHTFARHGYGYWLFFWGPEDSQDVLADQFADLREKFKLYNDREGWKPSPRESDLVRGATVAFQANFAKEVWKNETNAKDADPAAELLLRGFDPVEDEGPAPGRVVVHAGKSAEIYVLVLPPAADLPSAVKAAKEHILKRAAEANPEVKIEPAVEPTGGKGAIGKDVGAFPGHVERIRLVLGPDTEKFGLVAVTRRTEGVLVIYGECKWDRRTYWEQEFKAFLDTVRPSTKGAK